MINAIIQIIQYESGELNEQETIELFAELVGTGFINCLQGHYQHTAAAFIEGGYISEDGEVL